MAIALASSTAVSLAQTAAPSPAPAESKDCTGKKEHKRHGKDRFEALNLTPDQKTRIDALQADFRAKKEVIRSNAALSTEQKKEQVKGLREANRTQIEASLTPEQIALLHQAKSGHREHHKKGGDSAPPASPTT